MAAPSREIAPGVHWLGDCMAVQNAGRWLHGSSSVYLVEGGERSLLVESGHPADLQGLELQVSELLEAGAPPLEYLFVTHSETPHAGGIARLMHHFPGATAVGDVSDLHLVVPEHADRLRQLAPGDTIDLGGGVEVLAVEAVFRDMISTRWLFALQTKVLFAGDGAAYSHLHAAGQCRSFTEEAPDLPIQDMTALFAEFVFAWTRHVDLEPYIERLDDLIFRELGAAMIAPTHGLVISDPEATMPLIYEGLRQGARSQPPSPLPEHEESRL
jgi:flavorubredoxin